MAGHFSSVDCERARAAVSVLVDGELSELGRARLEAHTATCAGCREFARVAAAAAEALRASGLEPAEFPIILPRPRHRVARFVQTGTAVAAAAAVAVVALTGALHPVSRTAAPAPVPRFVKSPQAGLGPIADVLRLPRAVSPLGDRATRLTR